MKFKIFSIVALFLLSFVVNGVLAKMGDDNQKKSKVVDANVWTTEDGKQHFVCPVMDGEDVVDANASFSVVDSKKYYHCCGGYSDKLTANPEKYLKNFAVPGDVIKVDADGQHFQCPVSGKMGLVTDKTKYSDVNGKRFYFRCNNCKTKFDANSEKFLKSEGKKV